MTQEQDNITTMFETTNSTLDKNNALWSMIPAFADAVTRAKTGTAAIREKEGAQEPTVDAEIKQAARDDAEEKGLHLASHLAAFASKTGDFALALAVDVDKSKLDRWGISDLMIALKKISKGAADHSAVLASDYLIPAAEITAFDAAITKLDGLKTTPRDAVIDHKVATLSLPDAIVFVRGIYRNELDKMMVRFKKTEPDFYGAYFAARIIIDKAATHTTAQKKQTLEGGKTAVPKPA